MHEVLRRRRVLLADRMVGRNRVCANRNRRLVACDGSEIPRSVANRGRFNWPRQPFRKISIPVASCVGKWGNAWNHLYGPRTLTGACIRRFITVHVSSYK